MSSNHSIRPLGISIFSALLLWLSWSTGIGGAQSKSAEELKKATQRSESAANILTGILNVPDKGIPKELIERAEAIAVFPHVVKAKFVLQQWTIGYGLISRRSPRGWSLPAYYRFTGGGIELNIAGGESADIVLLFMNDETVNLFQKGRLELKGNIKAVSGPVGEVTTDRKEEMAKSNIIAYVRSKGELRGISIKSDLLNGFILNPDNNINKAIYGVKGRDILAGRPMAVQSPPQSVDTFTQFLNKVLPDRRR
jgi:lipid-binding SYLF domain-containing protein